MQFLKYALAAFSIGSAVAAPALPVVGNAVGSVLNVADVEVLVGTVAQVKVTVEGQLSNIQKITEGGNVAEEKVPELKDTLKSVRKEILSIEASVDPLLQAVVQLDLGDLKVVLDLVNDVTALVNGVEATVENLLNTLPAHLQKLLQRELTYVLNVLQPVLSPVLDLVSGLVGSNQGAIVNEINGVVGQLNGLLDGLLGGLLGTVLSIL